MGAVSIKGMEKFWADFEEAKFRASHTSVWSSCDDVLQLAADHDDIGLVAEILKLQGVLIMKELWKMFPQNDHSVDPVSH